LPVEDENAVAKRELGRTGLVIPSRLASFRPHIDAFGSKLGSIKFVSKVEKAYNRTRMVEQRREVMERWATFAYAIVNFST
jgi:hypothetical protein